jgi:hypothetical protein
LEKLGWMVLRPINISKSGLPDLWVLKNGQCVFVEVKKPGEKPTELQAQRHKELSRAGFIVVVATSEKDINTNCVFQNNSTSPTKV